MYNTFARQTGAAPRVTSLQPPELSAAMCLRSRSVTMSLPLSIEQLDVAFRLGSR